MRSTERGDHVGKIASAYRCARSTVQDVLKKADENGVSWEDVAGLSESAAYELIRGRPQQSSEYAAIDYGRVKAEMDRDHTMTLTILWEEYAMLAARNKERTYGYSRFCERYVDWCDEHDVLRTMKNGPTPPIFTIHSRQRTCATWTNVLWPLLATPPSSSRSAGP